MSNSPFQPPQARQMEPGSASAPPVIIWFRIYCILMALMYIAVFAFGMWLAVAGDQFGEQAEVAGLQFQGVVMAVVSVPLTILFGLAPILPRKSWAWIYGFVPICIGMTSCCTLPFSIALIIFWLKPETQHYFGRNVSPPAQGV